MAIQPTNPTIQPGPLISVRPVALLQVQLTVVASRASYYQGEVVDLQLSLENKSTQAVGLSDLSQGNLVLTSME